MPSISFGVSIHRFHPDAVLAEKQLGLDRPRAGGSLGMAAGVQPLQQRRSAQPDEGLCQQVGIPGTVGGNLGRAQISAP